MVLHLVLECELFEIYKSEIGVVNRFSNEVLVMVLILSECACE